MDGWINRMNPIPFMCDNDNKQWKKYDTNMKKREWGVSKLPSMPWKPMTYALFLNLARMRRKRTVVLSLDKKFWEKFYAIRKISLSFFHTISRNLEEIWKSTNIFSSKKHHQPTKDVEMWYHTVNNQCQVGISLLM